MNEKKKQASQINKNSDAEKPANTESGSSHIDKNLQGHEELSDEELENEKQIHEAQTERD